MLSVVIKMIDILLIKINKIKHNLIFRIGVFFFIYLITVYLIYQPLRQLPNHIINFIFLSNGGVHVLYCDLLLKSLLFKTDFDSLREFQIILIPNKKNINYLLLAHGISVINFFLIPFVVLFINDVFMMLFYFLAFLANRLILILLDAVFNNRFWVLLFIILLGFILVKSLSFGFQGCNSLLLLVGIISFLIVLYIIVYKVIKIKVLKNIL